MDVHQRPVQPMFASAQRHSERGRKQLCHPAFLQWRWPSLDRGRRLPGGPAQNPPPRRATTSCAWQRHCHPAMAGLCWPHCTHHLHGRRLAEGNYRHAATTRGLRLPPTVQQLHAEHIRSASTVLSILSDKRHSLVEFRHSCLPGTLSCMYSYSGCSNPQQSPRFVQAVHAKQVDCRQCSVSEHLRAERLSHVISLAGLSAAGGPARDDWVQVPFRSCEAPAQMEEA